MKILTALILILFYIPIRPLEPPVPFPYDPNQVNYEIIETIRAYPNADICFTRLIVEPDGQVPELTFTDPTIWISQPTVTIDPADPNGISRIYAYECIFPVNRPPGKYYFDVQAGDNDPNEPMYDNRSMIIYLWPKNRPPVIR